MIVVAVALRLRLLLLLLLACEVEDGYVCPLRHFDLAELPVHGFRRTPGHLHLFGDLLPHVLLESVKTMGISLLFRVHRQGQWNFLPLVEPGEFVLFLLIPFGATLKVVLEAQTTADGAAIG